MALETNNFLLLYILTNEKCQLHDEIVLTPATDASCIITEWRTAAYALLSVQGISWHNCIYSSAGHQLCVAEISQSSISLGSCLTPLPLSLASLHKATGAPTPSPREHSQIDPAEPNSPITKNYRNAETSLRCGQVERKRSIYLR